MSDRKEKKNKENEPLNPQETDAVEAGTTETLAVSQEELDALKKQLEEAQAQAADFKDGWQRSRAEFDNYRKRVERENQQVYQNAVGNIIKRYLPVMDDLLRALQARPADLAWAAGIELIYRKLQSILDSEGITRIEAEGQAFDPNFHEAITQEHSDVLPSGHVVAVVQNGYMLGDKVIRPAMVRVSE
jgi:molecular chaperone GrpE